MKYFFFKEKDPKKSLSDIDKDFVENIYKIAKKIVVLNDEDELKRALANYYFFAFLLFDFLFAKKEKFLIGYFSMFKTDRERFIQVKELILKQIEQVKDEKSFMKLSDEIIGHVVNVYINEQVKIKSIIDIKKVYENFIKLREENKEIYIEPFSYFIAYEIWKYGKLLRRVSDSINVLTDEIIKKSKKHLKLYFKIIEDAYKSEKIDYKEMFDFQYKIIEYINKSITFDNINILNLPKETKYPVSLEESKIQKKQKLVKFRIDKMLSEGEDTLSLEELNYILITLFNKIKVDENTALFGIYSSGAFLAHMYNFFNATNKEIILFKAFPFMDFHPIYLKDKIRDYKNFIIFDDTIRTGFTFSLLKNTFFRAIKEELKNYNLVVISKSKYMQEYFDYNMKFFANHYCDKIQPFGYKVNVDFKQFVYEDVSSIIKSIVGDIQNKIDYTIFLSNTRLAFSIAYDIAEKIIKSSKNNKKIALFFTSSSSSSKTLTLLVAYILRYKKCNVVIDCFKEGYFKVVIDLTIKTRYTLDRFMALKNLKDEDLDLICVIYNYGKKDEKIYEVFKNGI